MMIMTIYCNDLINDCDSVMQNSVGNCYFSASLIFYRTMRTLSAARIVECFIEI